MSSSEHKAVVDMLYRCGPLSFSSTKDEFCAWRKKIVTVFKIAKLSDVIVNPSITTMKDGKEEDGDTVAPGKGKSSKDNLKLKTDEESKSLVAYGLILSLLDSKLTKQMDSIKEGDAIGLMEALNNKFNPQSSTTEVQLKVDLFTIKMKENHTINDFANEIQNIASELNRFGEQTIITDSDMQYALYQGCTESYKEYIKLLISNGQKKTFQDLINQLRTYELLNKSDPPKKQTQSLTDSLIESKVFSAYKRGNNRSCHLCKKEGHFVKDCPHNLLNKQKTRKENFCEICRKSNHSINECRFNGLKQDQDSGDTDYTN